MSERSDVRALMEMARALPPLALVELERAVWVHLEPNRYERGNNVLRARLGPLADLLDRDPARTQDGYDRARPAGAPSSDSLVAVYGSWKRVMQAVAAYRPPLAFVAMAAEPEISSSRSDTDSERRRVLVPSPVFQPGAPTFPCPSPHPYSTTRAKTDPELAARAVREVALKVGRPLTSGMYELHVSTARKRAKQSNAPRPWWPCLTSVQRAFGSWERAWEGAAVSDEELRQARIARLPVGMASSRTASSSPSAEAADSRARADLPSLPPLDQVSALPLADAVALARRHGGSLAWVCGRDPVPLPDATPPADARLDLAALRAARVRCGLSDATLRRVSGLPAGAWRQLIAGAFQPDTDTLLRLADAVGLGVDELVRGSSHA